MTPYIARRGRWLGGYPLYLRLASELNPGFSSSLAPTKTSTPLQAVLLLAIFGVFQPYPTLADPMLAGCLFLCHPRTSARMRIVIPVCMVALVPSFLLPTMRHLWLQAGTGNANFYYFQTVVLNVLLSVFVLQFVAALVKRRKALAVAFTKRRKSSAAATLASGAGGSGVDGAVREGSED